jgi:hypothetical protein
MRNALRIITAITGLLAGSTVLHDRSSSTAQAAPAIEMIGMSAAEQEGAMRSARLFADAGLDLPPVTIRRHTDTTACNGYEGVHHKAGNRSVIDICTPTSGAWEERTILHELSHAWAFHYLTPQHEQAFKAIRGWHSWLDYGRAEWKDNGAEQAAEIMVWALSDHPVHPVKIDRNSCAELHAGYVALTGLQPLHGYTNLCDEKTQTVRS